MIVVVFSRQNGKLRAGRGGFRASDGALLDVRRVPLLIG